MANPEHVEILKQGVKVWNEWRLEDSVIRSNLTYSDLSRADLSRANLWNADLTDAALTDADLSDSLLGHTNFNQTILRGTKFNDATIGYTAFDNTDLSEAVGLETVNHHEPSSLGIDTIFKSRGQIPEKFLRGCGLTDWQIETAKLHQPDLSNEEITNILYRIHDLRAHQAIQISPLFISYSHKDSPFVDKMERYLNEKGIRFWRDVHHATAGRLERQIERAIRLNPTVLLILSANSVESDWVEHEARLARKLEQETKRDVLCPVALDDSWKDCHWPERLREQITEYNILNFSEWNDEDTFKRMFTRLIEGLDLFYK